MSWFLDVVARVCSADGFVPRRVCGLWPDWLVWEHVAGNALVWLAYVAMPVMIWRLGVRRPEWTPFKGVVRAFALFIALCGLGHFLDMLAFFRPMYRLSGHVLVVTGLVSWWTAWSLRRAWPALTAMRSSAELERVIAERTEELERTIDDQKRAEKALRDSEERFRKLNETLERRIAARTAELTAANRALRESEERYRTVVEDQTELVCRACPDGTLTFVNDVYCRFFGKRREDLMGRRWQPAAHPEDLDRVEAELGRLESEHPVVVIVNRVFDVRGQVRWMEFVNRAFFAPDGRLVEIQAVGRDITKRKVAEEKLHQAVEAAEAATRAKSEFLANMSHEIRTPMSGVIGMTELLLNAPLDDLQRGYAETIRSSGEALLTVINDILDFSKIEAGRLTLESTEFDLRALIDGVVDLLAPRAHQKGLAIAGRVAPAVPRRLVGDPVRIRQVLTNLAGNAVKFTERGAVDLSAHLVAEDAGVAMLRVLVRDTGIGIPEDRQAEIFESFTQIEGGNSRRHGGTGLGLAICRSLADLMGGRIGLESRPSAGSTFWFELPLGKASGEADVSGALRGGRPADGSGEARRVSSLRILVAEDNEVNRRVAIGMAEQLGCAAEAVCNGREALEALDYGRHDLVLMDVQMPEMDGLTATAAIRERERGTGRHIPIIALTAHAMQGDRERCLAAGMDGYMAKPIRFGRLRDVLDAWGARDEPPSNGQGHRRDLDVHSFSARILGESCGDDPKLIREVLGLMLKGVPVRLERLEAAVGAGEGHRVSREAHGLMGAFATVGAEALAAACQELMTLGERGDCTLIDAAYRRIRDHWGRLEEEANLYFETLGFSDGAIVERPG